MTRKKFFAECAAIMGVHHEYRDATPNLKLDRDTGKFWRPPTRGGRRSGREPGNGRFSPFGVVRPFGDRVHVALSQPVIATKQFESHEAALAYLRTLDWRQ